MSRECCWNNENPEKYFSTLHTLRNVFKVQVELEGNKSQIRWN